LREEVLALHALVTAHGVSAVLTAMAQAEQVNGYSAAYVAALLAAPADRTGSLVTAPLLVLPGVPRQGEVDRQLSHYEAYVQRSGVTLLAGEVPA
ncbi:MAG: hypothetical protein AB7U18_16835, partial [Dehalococcoidia bacterium]